MRLEAEPNSISRLLAVSAGFVAKRKRVTGPGGDPNQLLLHSVKRQQSWRLISWRTPKIEPTVTYGKKEGYSQADILGRRWRDPGGLSLAAGLFALMIEDLSR